MVTIPLLMSLPVNIPFVFFLFVGVLIGYFFLFTIQKLCDYLDVGIILLILPISKTSWSSQCEIFS